MQIDLLAAIHTYPQGNSERYALHIADIAQHLNANVHALILGVDFPTVSSAFGNPFIDIPSLIRDSKAMSRDRGSVFVTALEPEVRRLGVSLRTTEVECYEGQFGEVVTGYGRYHDLVVLGMEPADSTSQKTAEEVVFGSGRPTLLVHENYSPGAFEHVMIAWDGSRVATRAVSDAREFLKRAKNITIATVTDEKTLPDGNPCSKLLDYFTRHNIDGKISQVQGRGRPIAETLQDHARDLGAGLLVMGGFGHSRMRDFVLGGATSGVLRDLRLSVLLSH